MFESIADHLNSELTATIKRFVNEFETCDHRTRSEIEDEIDRVAESAAATCADLYRFAELGGFGSWIDVSALEDVVAQAVLLALAVGRERYRTPPVVIQLDVPSRMLVALGSSIAIRLGVEAECLEDCESLCDVHDRIKDSHRVEFPPYSFCSLFCGLKDVCVESCRASRLRHLH